jgi:hypothetical protein
MLALTQIEERHDPVDNTRSEDQCNSKNCDKSGFKVNERLDELEHKITSG